jgi:hypothetical protein
MIVPQLVVLSLRDRVAGGAGGHDEAGSRVDLADLPAVGRRDGRDPTDRRPGSGHDPPVPRTCVRDGGIVAHVVEPSN